MHPPICHPSSSPIPSHPPSPSQQEPRNTSPERLPCTLRRAAAERRGRNLIGGRAPKKQSAPQIDAPMRRGAEGAPCAQPHAHPRGKELPAMRTVRDGVLLPRGGGRRGGARTSGRYTAGRTPSPLRRAARAPWRPPEAAPRGACAARWAREVWGGRGGRGHWSGTGPSRWRQAAE